MTNERIAMTVQSIQQHIPQEKVPMLRHALQTADEKCADALISTPMKSPTATVLLSVFLGWLGVDRFYIGDIGLGAAKLLLGWITCGIWPLIDIFFSYKKAKEKNLIKLMAQIF